MSMRYVNVTLVDWQGSPRCTQLWSGDGWMADVSDWIRKKQDEIAKDEGSYLFAFAFDTKTRSLQVFNLAQEVIK